MIKFRGKRTPSLPCHESIVSRNAQKQRRWKIYRYTSVPMEIRLKLFFAQLFLLISSVSTEQSQICVRKYGTCQTRTVRPRVGRTIWTPLFEPARLLMTTPTPSTDDPAQEDLLQKYRERVERLSQQDRVIKICTDAGFPENS